MSYIRITPNGGVDINGRIISLTQLMLDADSGVEYIQELPPTDFKLNDKWTNPTTNNTARAILFGGNVVWALDEKVTSNELSKLTDDILNGVNRLTGAFNTIFSRLRI